MSESPTSGSTLPVRRPGGVRAHLESRGGPEKGETFRLAPGVTVIGRDPSCDIQLSEPAISRQHCRIDHAEDQWVLRNLSSNGTRIKRKEIEEHVLSDGDEIRIGAKTRLVFALEERAAAQGARPQFRPRTAESDADDEEEEPETAEAEEEETQSLFQRRRGLFIGLGAYVGILLVGCILAAVFLAGGGGTGGGGGIPRLALETRIIPAGTSQPLRVESTSPNGTYCVDDRGRQILVPHEDLQTGRARRVPGIRQAVEVQFLTPEEFQRRKQRGNISPRYPYVLEKPRNPHWAKLQKEAAIKAYQVSDVPGNERKLYEAVRGFQRALAHYGMRFLPDPDEDKIRQKATKTLINRIHEVYRQGIRAAKAGDYAQAKNAFETIQDYMPEPDNIIYRNVSRRLSDVRRNALAKQR